MGRLLVVALLCLLAVAPTLTAAAKVVAYYTNWAQYRVCNKYFPENLAAIASKVDVVNFAFAKIDGQGNLFPIEWNDCVQGMWSGCQAWAASASMYDRLHVVRNASNPNMKLMISIGGWTWGGVNTCPFFSSMASTSTSRANFISQAIRYCDTFQWDGVDLDWEYPGAVDRSCGPADVANFQSLLSEFRTAIQQHAKQTGKTLLLTLAAPAAPANIANFKPGASAAFVDWINLMSYDFHGDWDGKTGFNTPMTDSSGAQFSVTQSVQNYLNAGVPPSKLVVGMATYGRSFALSSASCAVGTVANSGGAQSCTNTPGTLAYYEAASYLKLPGTQSLFDATTQSTYACNLDTNMWISYDDVKSLSYKMALVNKLGLAGGMVWTLDFDDFPNGYPLISAIRSQLK